MTQFDPSRRALFRRLTSVPASLPSEVSFARPPHAKAEVDFLALCAQCGECLSACPTNALTLVQGFPVLSAPERCDSCMACTTACRHGALDKGGLTLRVTSQCSPALAIYCQSCQEQCASQAITIQAGHAAQIDAALCNGCAACIPSCDFNAIQILN
ncbi:4Fe-4S binding protein [Vibrio porteresiae]|uniref:4Fe-4S binding protein n=1 Tax=Vibrio porteresiae DSM 19223 TaxID=1123496 RepID=A0ABZ0QIA7_9VIBR|nr:4Fe-4S binding protein [Vibrio porteresiae]WPC75183.1 4Fe-4S binding protein [Vibrio porteresiae DSM 19223]